MVLRFPVFQCFSVTPSAPTPPSRFFAGWSFTVKAAQHFPYWVGATVGTSAAHFIYLYKILLWLFLLEKFRPSPRLLFLPPGKKTAFAKTWIGLGWKIFFFLQTGINSSHFDDTKGEKTSLSSVPIMCVVCDPVSGDKPQRENLHTMKPLNSAA